MRDAELRPDAGCGVGMRNAGKSDAERGHSNEAVSASRIALSRFPHRVEIPHPAAIPPLTTAVPRNPVALTLAGTPERPILALRSPWSRHPSVSPRQATRATSPRRSFAMKCSPARGVAVVIATAITAAPLAAQLVSPRSIPQTYAITNARIVPVSSPAIEKGTIVIRDGIITAVGATVTAPGDARIVDGSGLTVYPGLIDSYTALGLGDAGAAGGGRGGGGGGRPRGGGSRPPGGGGGPPALGATAAPRAAVMSNNPLGLQPENSAVEFLMVDPEAFSGPQSVGITAALTAPPTGIYMGQSALINLGGSEASSLVVKSPVSLNIGFTPSRGGGYPNSLMGVFAALRQSLLDAQHYRDVAAAYAKNPRGMKRLEFDPSLDPLQPGINTQTTVVMRADSKREIERALDLAKEFNLKVVIAGGAEAYTLTDRLKAENVPVLLSVDYPRRAAQAADADPEPMRMLRDRVEASKAGRRLRSFAAIR